MSPSPSQTTPSQTPRRGTFSPRSLSKKFTIVLLLAVPLLVLAGVCYFVALPYLESRSNRKLAQEAIDKGDFASGTSHLRRSIELWPSSAESHFLLARTLRRAGDFDDARDNLDKAERLDWVPKQIKLERLLLQAQAGAPQAVEAALRGYFADLPSDAKFIFEALVIGYAQANFLDDAYRWSTLWIEVVPEDSMALYWRGRVLEFGYRDDLAAEDYLQALEKPFVPQEAHFRLGEVLKRRGQFEEALPHFEQYLNSKTDNPAALLSLAQCQRSLNSPDEARATLDLLFEHHQKNAGGCLLRGQLELDVDNPQEALKWLRQANSLTPHDVEVNHFLATALRRLNRVDEAEQFEKYKAELEKDLKRLQQLSKEIIEQPRNVSLRYEAGVVQQRLGQDQQAARWLISALLVDPTHEPTRQALAECLPKLGDTRLTEYYRQFLKQPSHGRPPADRIP